MTGAVRVSFCATNLNTVDRLATSIASIDRIGAALGVPYEVVVADGPSTDGARAWLEAHARTAQGFRLVPHGERSRGYGRRRAFDASSGTTIVPFDTSIEYSDFYAELLQAYLHLATDRLFFSEICAASRRSIMDVGGWRDLVGGEDIDLYVRLIRRFGVLAYPTARRESQSHSLGAFERQMRYVTGSALSRLRRIYVVQRDQIIGANYRVHDLMRFSPRKGTGQRVARWGFFSLAYVGSRFQALKPFEFGRSNYLLFREALLESMERGDYREMGLSSAPPQLLLTEDEFAYLRLSSARWSHWESVTPQMVGPK